MPEKYLEDVRAGDYINGRRVIWVEPVLGGCIRLQFESGPPQPAARPKTRVWVDDVVEGQSLTKRYGA